MPRKTDTQNPGDWLDLVESDLAGLKLLTEHEVSFGLCRSKLAEVLEKSMKAELIRLGWFLEKTHDLRKLGGYLDERGSDLIDALRPLCDSLTEAYFADRYVGFDVEEPDWPSLRAELIAVTTLAATIRARLPA